MESLAETSWDVTISGTGLAQSLLALALSRSGKNVLHVDKNPYYGGSEAAFSLQEAEEWVDKVNQDPGQTPFEDAAIYSPLDSPETEVKLSSSRSYTLSLSPHLVYARSKLLPTLVSSRVHKQVEFQAVGSWWIYTPASEHNESRLYRVPSSREDVFADNFITVKSKRTLMRFLRHIAKPFQDDQVPSESEEDLSASFPDYLASKFHVPTELHYPLLSLSLSQSGPLQTAASYAIPRIQRHLGSIGVFGPGFGSLLARWGGDPEISQVGCRAMAVGGGVYVLNTGIRSFAEPSGSQSDEHRMLVQLSSGIDIQTKYLVGSNWDLPIQADARPSCRKVARSITIVSSPLEHFFPPTAEGGPVPVGAVVVFPGNSLDQAEDSPLVYLVVHSSETCECPAGQSVIYGSVSIPGPQGQSLVKAAVDKLLATVTNPNGQAKVLWSLQYTQLGRENESVDAAQAIRPGSLPDNVICFPPSGLDLAFEDATLDMVKEAWKLIMGDGFSEDEFMKFEDREAVQDDNRST